MINHWNRCKWPEDTLRPFGAIDTDIVATFICCCLTRHCFYLYTSFHIKFVIQYNTAHVGLIHWFFTFIQILFCDTMHSNGVITLIRYTPNSHRSRFKPSRPAVHIGKSTRKSTRQHFIHTMTTTAAVSRRLLFAFTFTALLLDWHVDVELSRRRVTKLNGTFFFFSWPNPSK